MTKKIIKPELLAPAGNLEKMKTALAFGADAVYAGIPDFSLRTRINDFTAADIKKAAEYCHARNKKIYITLNIFAHNQHLGKLPAHIRALKKIKVDALVISDPGIINLVKKIWPSVNIHLSTQANCANWQAVKFWQKQGVKRIILSRELGVKEIAEIHKKVPGVELECFVHGAMCMAYSGRCFLSKYFTDRNANLGDCVQLCRWKYGIINNEKLIMKNKDKDKDKEIFIKPEGREEMLELIEEEHGSYILNSEDLCLIKRLEELKKAGIVSFKIEGRAKSVYYLAAVIGAYREAIDAKGDKKKLNYLYNELKTKLVNRGYTEGFTFGNGRLAQNINDSHYKCDWEFCGEVVLASAVSKNLPSGRFLETGCSIFVKVHNTIKVGEEIEIVRPNYDIIKLKIRKMFDLKTGEQLSEAHGGQGKTVVIESKEDIPEFSILRRKI
jgi:putative protease